MGNGDFKIILEALLDQSSLTKIEKKLAKKKISLGVDFEFAKSIKDTEEQIKELSQRFKTIFNFKTDAQSMSFTKKYLAEANKIIAQSEKMKQKEINDTISAYRNQQQAQAKADVQNTKNRTSNVNSILTEEIQSLNKIANIRANIVTQKSGGNTSQISVLNEQLRLEKEHYNTLHQEASGYTDIISQEQQRKILKEESYKAELKVKQAQAKADDKSNKNIRTTELKEQVKYMSDFARLSKANSIQTWADNNSKAMKKHGKEINAIILRYKELEKEMSTIDSQKLQSEFNGIKLSARQAGDLGATAGEKLKKAWEKFGGWSIATTSFMYLIRAVKDGIRLIAEFDDALTDVAYTSDFTANGLEKLSNKSMYLAKDLNTSAKNILEAVKIYSNANESVDSILRKAKPAVMLSNVSGMSGSESSKTIQTILNQFDIDATAENLMDVIDTLESASGQLAYDFADGMKEISSGISVSGSVAKMAGLDLKEYSALLGVMIEQTGQSGDTVSNAMKTIISRITSASKGMGTMSEDISNAEKSFKEIGIAIRSDDGTFRDFGDIMSDLSTKWETMNDVQKSNVSFYAAGTRQVNIIKSLATSWDRVEDVTAKVNDSSGIATKNQEIYADSLKGHLGELTATGESVWTNLLDSEGLKDGIDGLNGLLTIVDKLASSLGLLGTAGLIGGGILGVKNLGRAKMFAL